MTATPGDAQVSLAWCQPVSDPDNPYYGYYIYEGTRPGGESTQLNDSPLGIAVTSYDVTGLTDGTTYYFVVQAVSKLSSYPSTEAGATPAGSTSAPGAPTGLTITAGSSQVSLSWTAPQSDGGSPVTSYNVYQGTFQGGESEIPATSANGTTATVTGLSNGTTYYFVVTAVNATGEGPSSNEAAAAPAGRSSGGSGSGGSGGSGGQGSGGQPVGNPPAGPANSVPVPVILLGAAILAVGVTLAGRRLRARSRSPSALETNVRAEPRPGPPGQVAIHSTGSQPTVTVRFEPHPGASSTMIEEIQP